MKKVLIFILLLGFMSVCTTGIVNAGPGFVFEGPPSGGGTTTTNVTTTTTADQTVYLINTGIVAKVRVMDDQGGYDEFKTYTFDIFVDSDSPYIDFAFDGHFDFYEAYQLCLVDEDACALDEFELEFAESLGDSLIAQERPTFYFQRTDYTSYTMYTSEHLILDIDHADTLWFDPDVFTFTIYSDDFEAPLNGNHTQDYYDLYSEFNVEYDILYDYEVVEGDDYYIFDLNNTKRALVEYVNNGVVTTRYMNGFVDIRDNDVYDRYIITDHLPGQGGVGYYFDLIDYYLYGVFDGDYVTSFERDDSYALHQLEITLSCTLADLESSSESWYADVPFADYQIIFVLGYYTDLSGDNPVPDSW
jgi:hypothetical protein